MEINCSKTKKVVANAEGKIHPMQTVTRLATYVIQVALNRAKVKQIYIVKTSEPLMSRKQY